MAAEARTPVNLDDYAEGIWAKPVDLNSRKQRGLTFTLVLCASYFTGALPMFRVRDAIPEPSFMLDAAESTAFPLLLPRDTAFVESSDRSGPRVDGHDCGNR